MAQFFSHWLSSSVFREINFLNFLFFFWKSFESFRFAKMKYYSFSLGDILLSFSNRQKSFLKKEYGSLAEKLWIMNLCDDWSSLKAKLQSIFKNLEELYFKAF